MTDTIQATGDARMRHIVSTSGQMHTPKSPFVGEVISSVPLSSVADVAAAVRAARVAQAHWVQVSYTQRKRIFARYHDLVLARQDEILDVIQRETGKARGQAMEEIFHVAMNAEYLARHGKKVLAREKRAGLFPLLTSTHVHQVPKGVVGVITPWNYPFTLAISDALAAVFAGNTVVIKPDLQTVWSAIIAVDLLVEAGLPEGIATIVIGDGVTHGSALVDEVDFVCFTGSTATGRIVGARAASRLVGSSLELGGKNPMLVLKDADLDKAMDICVHASFTSAGQLCVSTERIYVAKEIYSEFVDRLIARVSNLRIEARMGWGYDVGSMTTSAQWERTQAAVARAIEQGAHIAIGGHSRPEVGPLVFEPTVLVDVSPTSDVARQEVFGPVVFVTPFDTVEDAISSANNSPYGLSASVITRGIAQGRHIATQIRSGSVNINEGFGATFGSVSAPMGGMGDSGLGRRHGPEGILRFTEPQTISVQYLVTVGPQFGLSDSQWVRVMTHALKLLKALRLR